MEAAGIEPAQDSPRLKDPARLHRAALAAATIVLLLLVLTAPANAQGSSRWPALTAIAEQFVDGPVDLTCDTIHDAYEGGDPAAFDIPRSSWVLNRLWGYTFPYQRAVTLSPLLCAAVLTAYLYPRGGETYLLDDQGDYKLNDGLIGFAIHGFTHELGHVVLGYTQHAEGDAECFALAHDVQVARLFGFDRRRAANVLTLGRYFHSQLPSVYHEGCP